MVVPQERMRLGDVRDVLRKTRHAGFPVVREMAQGPVFVGLVVRDHLMKLLIEAVKRGTCEHLEVGGGWVVGCAGGDDQSVEPVILHRIVGPPQLQLWRWGPAILLCSALCSHTEDRCPGTLLLRMQTPEVLAHGVLFPPPMC